MMSLTRMMKEVFTDESETIEYLLEFSVDHNLEQHHRLIKDVQRLHKIVTERGCK